MEDGETVFVTSDSNIHKETSHPVDKEIIRQAAANEDGIPIESKEQLIGLVQLANDAFGVFEEHVRRNIVVADAEQIRTLRIDKEHSWRMVAMICHDLFGGSWEPPSNQIMGMALCKVAAEFYREDYRKPPWN